MSNFMMRFFVEAFFELMICSMINLTSLEGPGGIFWWVISLVTLCCGLIVTLLVFSLYFKNGPYLQNTFAKGSILASFWGVRPLHEKRSKPTPGSVTPASILLEKTESIDVDTLMFSSNAPLNLKLKTNAIDIENYGQEQEQFEGGQQDICVISEEADACYTERGATTDRGLVTDQGLVITAEARRTPTSFEDEIEKKRLIHEFYRKEARLRLSLEDQVKVNLRFATVYEGLKLNTAHNSAVTHIFCFIVQRLVYAAIIVLMSSAPFIGNLILIAMSVGLIAFTLTENPWKDPEVKALAVMNEFFFYLLLVLILVSACISSNDSQVNENVGWIIILVLTFAIFVNLVTLLSKAYEFSRQLYLRNKIKKLRVTLLKIRTEKQIKKIDDACQ